MKQRMKWPWAAAMAACLAGGAPASAAVVKASFGVGVTVVATCRIIPGRSNQCERTASQASTIVAEKPVVTYSRDPKTGTTIETVEF